ncbi:MAG: WecB/TagA/CpsF family glycosyltransferase [Gemmatimonadota bacterium]
MSRNGSFRVLGVPVDAVQMPDAVERMHRWVRAQSGPHIVAVTGMHGVVEARPGTKARVALEDADLVVPDGMSLVWLGRLHGHRLPRRVYGPELMEEFCRISAGLGYRHYFYGGAEGVAEDLSRRLRERFPGMQVAGWYSPPFRELSEEERQDVCERINETRPDVLWVGLSTPKQELWMHRNRGLLRVPVMVGVGAAFDFHTGRVRQAPRWMRESGLEWSWRLMQEPRRLWRRYLLGGARFVWGVALELSGLRRNE